MKSIKDYKCKKCGCSEFSIMSIYQDIHIYKILQNGKRSKRYIVERGLETGQEYLCCIKCNSIIEDWELNKDGIVEVEE